MPFLMSKRCIQGKMQLGASPVIGFFLNRPFWSQKHHFKPKKQDFFYHKSLTVKRSPWSILIKITYYIYFRIDTDGIWGIVQL